MKKPKVTLLRIRCHPRSIVHVICIAYKIMSTCLILINYWGYVGVATLSELVLALALVLALVFILGFESTTPTQSVDSDNQRIMQKRRIEIKRTTIP